MGLTIISWEGLTMNKRHFLSKRRQQELLPLVAFEVTASLLAYKDILTATSFRRGNRVLWMLVALIQPIGPWLYFTFGQKSE